MEIMVKCKTPKCPNKVLRIDPSGYCDDCKDQRQKELLRSKPKDDGLSL